MDTCEDAQLGASDSSKDLEPEVKKRKLDNDAECNILKEAEKKPTECVTSICESTETPCEATRQNSVVTEGVKADNISVPLNGDKKDDKAAPKTTSLDNQEPKENQGALSEKDAGITEYLGRHPGFTAIIKQRYSDFIVNEIDLKGEVVHLTDMSVPNDEDLEDDEKNPVDTEVICAEDLEKLKEMISSENQKVTLNLQTPENKEMRKSLHMSVKKNFPQLDTKTVQEDGKTFITAFWRKGKDSRSQNEWPKSKQSCRYVRFVLYKENKDTMDFIGLMAKNLRVRDNLFQYAGTKDRRAKSCQEVTAHRIHPKKLNTLNKVLRNFAVGNYRYVSEPLKLGQLWGNRFTIVLRNVEGSREHVESAMESLKSLGFINYFGMQRFGTTSIPTYSVGRALLSSEWKKAVDLILMPRNDQMSKDNFQTIWAETGDAHAALQATPNYCGIERRLLTALKKKLPPLNAIENLPRNTRLLYVHSYQSFVWNKIVSRRLKELGTSPVKGDLVLPEGVLEDACDSDGAASPIVITEENLDQYTLKDVVLPLPGHRVVYPQNQVHDWYRDILKEDGLDIQKMERPQKDYSLPGVYRHIVVYPKDITWSHKRYDDYTMPLVLTDFDRIKGDTEVSSSNSGKLRALVLEMSLPSSCYATMALREVMRVDTSSRHQTTLNTT